MDLHGEGLATTLGVCRWLHCWQRLEHHTGTCNGQPGGRVGDAHSYVERVWCVEVVISIFASTSCVPVACVAICGSMRVQGSPTRRTIRHSFTRTRRIHATQVTYFHCAAAKAHGPRCKCAAGLQLCRKRGLIDWIKMNKVHLGQAWTRNCG